ncbi:MAG: cobaltochelatase subunit CobN, partial [Synergistaceae bacterium]|nr:cobaltochelatase subunit CobN [Synergistaceae bacterium]
MRTLAIKAALIVCFILSCWSAPAAEGDVSLVVIDSDSYVAHYAVASMDIPGHRVRAFCLSDLENGRDAKGFLVGSSVVAVDIMDNKLSGYIMEHGLIEGRKVFALRGSQDDASLKAQGFIFDRNISDYYSHLHPTNIQNMLRRAISVATGENIPYEPVMLTPENGLYHPGAEKEREIFTSAEDYLSWYKAREGYDPKRPWLGLMFFSTSLVEGQREAFDELIATLERGGFNMLPAFGKDRILLDSVFLDAERLPRVDAVLSFSLKFYMSIDEQLRKSVADLDVPIFNAINMYSSGIGEWRESPAGIPALDIIWTMATPEISGAIEPTPIMGKVERREPGGGIVFRYELIPGMAERVIPRIHNWIKLRKTPNGEKKVAILYYNNSQGKQNIGASYLNVFRSLEEITEMMKGAGYGIPADLKLDEEEIKGLVLRGGRNIGSWAPGELDELIASGQTVQLPIAEYKKWFAELPEDFRKRVVEQWGEPEASGIMTKGGNIIIPAVTAGNLVMLPEPARGITDDPIKLYHDPLLYPHHQYIAVYLWLKRNFGADAMVHLGTHATYEWLPGKQAGLSLSCPPEIMVTDIPNVYPYIMDDVGEGLQAKRRGRGVVIDHLTPPLVVAEGYREYLDLAALCTQYEQAAAFGADTSGAYLKQIGELAARVGLDKDMGLDGVKNGDDVTALAQHLEYLAKGTVPYGLHTFGRSPEGD